MYIYILCSNFKEVGLGTNHDLFESIGLKKIDDIQINIGINIVSLVKE